MNIENTCARCAYPKQDHKAFYPGGMTCPTTWGIAHGDYFVPYPRSRASETDNLRFALALGRIAAGMCGGDADSIWEEIDALLGVRFAWSGRMHWVQP